MINYRYEEISKSNLNFYALQMIGNYTSDITQFSGPKQLRRDERYLRVQLYGPGECRCAAQQYQPLRPLRDLLGALVPRRLVVLDEVRLVEDDHLGSWEPFTHDVRRIYRFLDPTPLSLRTQN